ncbi:ATP-dependent DNA helicase [Trichonephila clavipes]|nr:ATP-dependent DNA helicase [Trichonephila clavipes]
MQSPRRDNRDNFNNEITGELDYDFIALQHRVAELVPQLLPEQNHVFHQVLRKIDSGNGGLFFFDAPGGTGKTFLLNLLLMSEDSPICNFSKSSSRGRMLRECKLLMWDENTMSHQKAIEALNRTLQDLRDSTDIMGGMVVLLAGDF